MSLATLLTSSGSHQLRLLKQGTKASENVTVLEDELPELKLNPVDVPDMHVQPAWAVRNMPSARIEHLRRPNAVWSAVSWHTAGLTANLNPHASVDTFLTITPNVGWKRVELFEAGSCLAETERKQLAYQVRRSIYSPAEAGTSNAELSDAFKEGRHAHALAARLSAFALEHALAPFTTRLRPTSANDSYLYLHQIEGTHGQTYSIRNQSQLMPFCKGAAVNDPQIDPAAVIIVGPAALTYGCSLLASLGRAGGPCHNQRHALLRQFETGMDVLLVGNRALHSDWINVEAKDMWRAIHEAMYILQVYNNVEPALMNAWVCAMIDNLPLVDTTLLRETQGRADAFWDPDAKQGAGGFSHWATNGDVTAADRIDAGYRQFNDVPGFKDMSRDAKRGVMTQALQRERNNIPDDRLDCHVERVYSRPSPLWSLLIAGLQRVTFHQLPNGRPLAEVAAGHDAHPDGYNTFGPSQIPEDEWPRFNFPPVQWQQVQEWMWGVLSGRDTYRVYATTRNPQGGWNANNDPDGLRIPAWVQRPAGWPDAPKGASWVQVVAGFDMGNFNQLENVRVVVQRWVSDTVRPPIVLPDSDAMPSRWTTPPGNMRIQPNADAAAHQEWLMHQQAIMYRAAVNANLRGNSEQILNPNVDLNGARIGNTSQRIAVFLSGWANPWWLKNGEGAMKGAMGQYLATMQKCTNTTIPDEALVYLGGQHGLTPISNLGGAWVLAVAPPAHTTEAEIACLTSTYTWLQDQESLGKAIIQRRCSIEMAYSLNHAGPANVMNAMDAWRELPVSVQTMQRHGGAKSRQMDPDSLAKYVKGMATQRYPDSIGVYLQRLLLSYDRNFRHRTVRQEWPDDLRWHAAFVRPTLLTRETWAWLSDIAAPTRVANNEVRHWMRKAVWQAGGYVSPEGDSFSGDNLLICASDETMIYSAASQGKQNVEVQAWSPRGTSGMYRVEAPQLSMGRWLNSVEHIEHRVTMPFETQLACVIAMDNAAAKRGLANWDAVKASQDCVVLDVRNEVGVPYVYSNAPYENNVNGPPYADDTADCYNPAVFTPFPFASQRMEGTKRNFALPRAAVDALGIIERRGVAKAPDTAEASGSKQQEQLNAMAGALIKKADGSIVSDLTAATSLMTSSTGTREKSTTQVTDGTTTDKSTLAGGTQPTGDGRSAHSEARKSDDALTQIAALMASLSDADRAAMLTALGASGGGQKAGGNPGSTPDPDPKAGTKGPQASSGSDFS